MAAATPQKKPSRLAQVKTGRIKGPRRYMIYGPEGVGKTTLAAARKKSIILDVDGGSGMMQVARYPFRDDDLGHVPRTLGEFREGLRDLTENEHQYEGVIIDSLDRLEYLVTKHCCARDSKQDRVIRGIEDYGYGKGWQIVLDEMRLVLGELDRLRNERRVDVIIVAHAQIKKFANPSGEDWERWVLKASDKVAGYVKEWCDDFGFLHYQEGATVNSNLKSQKAKGWSTNVRLLEFDRSAAWDAKARLPLPPTVQVGIGDPWAPFERAIELAYSASPADIRIMIEEQCARIGDASLEARVKEAVTKAGDDTSMLDRYLSDLRRRPAANEVVNDEAGSEENAA